MKKYGFILGLMALFCCSSFSFAVERTTVTKDSAGTMSHVTAYITEAGQTVWQIMADGSVSMYVTQLNNVTGVTVAGKRGEIGVINNLNTGVSGVFDISGVSIRAGTMPANRLSEAVTTGVSSIGETITGKTFYINMTSSETLGGNSLYGTRIGNWGANNEVTATLPTPVKGMSVLFMNNQGKASASGFAIAFSVAGSVVGLDSKFSAGNSVVTVAGVTLAQFLSIEAWEDGYWFITGASNVRYRNK